MTSIYAAFLLLSLVVSVSSAQLTTFQKVSDFQQLAALFNTRYAPYEFKKQAVRYDGLDLTPWLDRVNGSQSDLDFLEICAEYVARFQDSHSGFYTNSGFIAYLGFRTDIYSNKVLINFVDPGLIQAGTLPLRVGDEVVMVDGKSADEWIEYFQRMIGDGNAISARRFAAYLMTVRPQAIIPRAHEIGDAASVVVKRQSGETLTVDVPWLKFGIPYISSPALPNPTVASEAIATPPEQPWKKMLRDLDRYKVTNRRYLIRPPSLKPVFDLPQGFILHRGEEDYEGVYSGSFRSGGLRIGFLRIPAFDYRLSDVADEISYLADTDGLIIDLMGNPGGYGCNAEAVAQYLIPTPFQSATAQIRVTWNDVRSAADQLDSARVYAILTGDDTDIAHLEKLFAAFKDAYETGERMTAALPLCGATNLVEPAKDRRGRVIAYQNPIMVLTDEQTASAAEILAAILQDNNRALLYGTRTNGAGGAVETSTAGAYSDGNLTITRTLAIRSQPVPAYIENIGVRPNIVEDYMTVENLLNQGKPFVDRFIKAAVDHISSKK